MKMLVMKQLFLTLPLLIYLCTGVPVAVNKAFSSSASAASKTPDTLKHVGMDLTTPIDVAARLKEAGVHSKMDGTELHQTIEPIIPIRRANRLKTDYAIQHLHDIGVEPGEIKRFKQHRSNKSGRGIYRNKRVEGDSKRYHPTTKGKSKFDRHIKKVNFNTEPQEAARQWWSLGVVGRSAHFGYHLDMMLNKKIASGTHTQGWKDEFMRSRDALISERRKEKLSPVGRKEDDRAKEQADKGSSDLSGHASTSKTPPVGAQSQSPNSSTSSGEHIQLFGVRMSVGRKGHGNASTSTQSTIASARPST
jgi:hypothetical protein